MATGSAVPQKLLTVEEAGKFLGVPVQTLYSWRATGKGPTAVKVGRHLRYRPESLAAWLDELEELERVS
jgi:excisionase family DNA binding protein